MNGIYYWRKKCGLTVKELAELSGLSIVSIQKLEKQVCKTTTLSAYMKIADALGRTVDQLLDSYDPHTLNAGESRRKSSRKALEGNIIALYCRHEDLSYQQLANRLGVTSRERARQLCRTQDAPEKHVSRLAAYEAIPVEEFIKRYAVA